MIERNAESLTESQRVFHTLDTKIEFKFREMDFNREKQEFFANMMCNWPRHLADFRSLQELVDENRDQVKELGADHSHMLKALQG